MGACECFMQTEFGGARSRDQNFTGRKWQKVDEFEPILRTILCLASFFCFSLLLLSTFKSLNALYSKFERLKISARTRVRLKLGVPVWGISLNRVLENFELLNLWS